MSNNDLAQIQIGGSVRSSELEIAVTLQKLYPKQFDPAKLLLLLGNAETIQQLQAGVAPEKIVAGWAPSLATFDAIRRKYLLYK